VMNKLWINLQWLSLSVFCHNVLSQLTEPRSTIISTCGSTKMLESRSLHAQKGWGPLFQDIQAQSEVNPRKLLRFWA
jgi:hypothetical protein